MSEGNGGNSSSWDLVTEIDRVLVREYAAHCCYWVNVGLPSGECGDQCLHVCVGRQGRRCGQWLVSRVDLFLGLESTAVAGRTAKTDALR